MERWQSSRMIKFIRKILAKWFGKEKALKIKKEVKKTEVKICKKHSTYANRCKDCRAAANQ